MAAPALARRRLYTVNLSRHCGRAYESTELPKIRAPPQKTVENFWRSISRIVK